jgi:hypothetical protein
MLGLDLLPLTDGLPLSPWIDAMDSWASSDLATTYIFLGCTATISLSDLPGTFPPAPYIYLSLCMAMGSSPFAGFSFHRPPA